jgi:cytochrome c55X
MQVIRRIALLAAAVVVTAPMPLSVLAQTETALSTQAEAEMVAKGKALYAERCSHCHGFNLVNPGTITYDLRTFPHNEKLRFMTSVLLGKNGRMPAWGDVLNQEDIDDLWAYVRTGGKQ